MRLKTLKKVNSEISLILLISLFFLQIAFSFYSFNGIALLIECILLLAVPICAFVFRKEECRIHKQMLMLNLGLAGLWGLGILCPVSDKSNIILVYGGMTCLLIGVTINIVNIRSNYNLRGIVVSNIIPFIISVLYFGMSIDTIGSVPIFDSGAYYSWSVDSLAPNFNFSFNNILDYCLAGHISVGYGLFALAGELLSPFTASGVQLINILLAMVSIFAFYKMLQNMFPEQSIAIHGLATSVYAFSPYILGMAGVINIDNPGVYMLVIMMYCHVREYNALELFWAWVFVCTKEPNLVYYTFFVLGILLPDMLQAMKNNDKRVFWSWLTKDVWLQHGYRCIPVVCWMIYYIAPGRNSWVASSEGLINDSGLHTIGFSIENTIVKFKELLIMNFNWIFAVIALIVILCAVKNRKIFIEQQVVLPMVTCLMGVILFNLFYLDYPHPRYFVIGTELMVILGIVALMYLGIADKLRIVLLSVIAVLMIGQSFVTIDPLTRLSFKSLDYYDTGSGLVTASGHKLDDSAIYNREYLYYIKALEKGLDQIEYGKDVILAFPGYENLPKAYGYSERFLWNTEKRIIQTKESEHTIPINIAGNAADLEAYERVVYIEPFFCKMDPDFLGIEKWSDKMEARYRTMTLFIQEAE